MSSKGKNKFYIMTGLTILFIIQFFIFTFITKDTGSLILLGTIALLGIAASFGLFLSIKKTARRISHLPEEYRNAYYNASEIIGVSAIRRNRKKEINAFILEIFEEAAREERSLDNLTNGNLTQFMKGFIDAEGGTPSRAYLFFFSSFLFIIYLIFMKTYVVLRHAGFSAEGLSSQNLDLGIIVLYAVIAYLFFPWMLYTIRKAASAQWTGVKRLRLLIPFIIPVILLLFLIMGDSPGIRALIDRPILIFSNIYSFFTGVLLAAGCWGMMQYFSRREARKALEL